MPFRLASLGDSLTQGFLSGAPQRGDLSYPALVARALGLRVPRDFRVPRLPCTGLPFNIEAFLRHVAQSTGPDVNTLEWIFRLPFLLHGFVDELEDCHERGPGSRPACFNGCYHNLAIWGLRTDEALSVTPELCEREIRRQEGLIEDDFLGIPSAPMFRTARQVLNPGQDPGRRGDSQVDTLEKLVREEGPLDALLLWYGANDALNTVLDLEVRDMADHEGEVPSDPHERRKLFNLTSAQQFREDYVRLAARLDAVVGETPVFVGTVPHVTIPPVTRGVPPFRDRYFDYYSRFFVSPDKFRPGLHTHLTRADAVHVDQRIDAFNAVVREAVEARGSWHLVDTAAALDVLAVKRNGFTDDPSMALRGYYVDQPGHPLLQLDPIPSLLMLETTERGRRLEGGLSSLDLIHPSTIGYGIVAELFLKAMHQAGIEEADPKRTPWEFILAQDSQLKAPPTTWDDVVEAADHNATLWDLILRVLG